MSGSQSSQPHGGTRSKLCMPGLDGPGTLARLRAVDPGIRCCFMSGGLGGHKPAALLEQGESFIQKPFQLDELVQSLCSPVPPRQLSSGTA
jgi:DNA-binding NtrC family response regulator